MTTFDQVCCILFGGLAMMLVLNSCNDASAHSEGGFSYPWECCSNLDCAPVEQWIKGEKPGDPITVVTKHGRASMPQSYVDRAQPGPDGAAHVCIRDGQVIVVGWSGKVCLFMNGGM